MKAKSIKGASVEDIKRELGQCMADGFHPTVAIVFISIKVDRNALCELLQNDGIDVIGATSSGEFINGHQTEGEIVVMLLDISRSDYFILFEDIEKRNLDEVAAGMAHEVLQKFKNPALILLTTSVTAKGDFFPGESLLRIMGEITGPQVNIFGGMAGDDMSFTGAYVFTASQSTDYGIATLVLNNDRISLYGMAISGWKPMGIFRTITKSEDNLIYNIDNKPALEMYLRFLGKELTSTDDQLEFFNSIGIHYPFQIERENRHPWMCSPIGYNIEKEALICESGVEQGSRFRFSTPPDFDILETVVDEAKKLKTNINTGADALLIFSCAGRFSALGPMAREENEGLYGVWNAPMAGFYTYGEFGPAANGKQEFHSTTCCWVALKENERED